MFQYASEQYPITYQSPKHNQWEASFVVISISCLSYELIVDSIVSIELKVMEIEPSRRRKNFIRYLHVIIRFLISLK